MDFEEDTYTAIFSALKHPIRRKILRMLGAEPATYTEMMGALGIETGLLNYHLESLSALLAKNEEGRYRLSDFGEAAMSLTRRVEEPIGGRVAQGVSASRRVTLVFITGLLIVGVALTSYSMVYTDVRSIKGYETIDHGDSWWSPNGLYGLESWTDHPGTLMNFWWSMNTTVDIYVMSREQYIDQRDVDGPPDRYLLHHVGSEGNITVMTESSSIDYTFAMYTGDSGTWEEEHGLSVYRWKPVKLIDNILLALDALLISSTVLLTALEAPLWSNIDKAFSKRQDSDVR